MQTTKLFNLSIFRTLHKQTSDAIVMARCQELGSFSWSFHNFTHAL